MIRRSMCSRVFGPIVLCLLTGLQFGALPGSLPDAAAADEASGAKSERPPARDEKTRWTPSLAIYGGFQEQEARGTISPGDLNPTAPQCNPAVNTCNIDQMIQPFSRNEDQIRRFRGGISAEVMTPRVLKGWGSPRFYVHVDPMWSNGFREAITGEGSPGPFVLADIPDSIPNVDPGNFSGSGTRIYAEVNEFSFNAGFGVAFSVDVLGQEIRIRPSAEYLRERLSVTGLSRRVVQVADLPQKNDPTAFRFIELRAVERKTYDAVGFGIELETDGARYKSIVISPFAGFQGYYFPGDLRVKLSDSNEYGETTEWSFSRDPWQWSGRFGIRLRYSPL